MEFSIRPEVAEAVFVSYVEESEKRRDVSRWVAVVIENDGHTGVLVRPMRDLIDEIKKIAKRHDALDMIDMFKGEHGCNAIWVAHIKPDAFHTYRLRTVAHLASREFSYFAGDA